ncbi:hypothetical protein AeMF1_015842 [Aphanomyces euteiches]|nr:hypothetical protein AeMF1_015842 [Aphanomyces euteiches]KAH9191381.1 hypothetical protein AeNC1_006645 [Aphanomyces euteiches]
MYSGTLGRVNALEFREASPSKGQITSSSSSPMRSPLKNSFTAAAATPTSASAIQRVFDKVKEVVQSSAACANMTDAELLSCLNVPSSPSPPKSPERTMATRAPPREPEPETTTDEQTLLLRALLASLTQLNVEQLQTGPPVTPPPSPVAASSPARPPPLKRTPSSLARIQENAYEDMDSPRSSCGQEVAPDDDYEDEDDVEATTETTLLPFHEAKRCLRGGSFASRIRVRRQPSLKELEEKRVQEVVEKLNRPSIAQLSSPRRLSVLDPSTGSLSRVNSMAELLPPEQVSPLTRKPSILRSPDGRRPSSAPLSRKSSSVSFAPEPTQPPPAPQVAPQPRKMKQKKYQARMSTLASHIKKLLNKSDKAKRAKAHVTLDASKRVSAMRLGTSPKKCKVKHEDLTTFTRPNCRPRRWVPKTGEAVLERRQTFVSLEVMDNIGTRAACPVHLLSEKSTADFSYVPGVVNSHNRRRRRRSSRRKLVKRPSLWIVD